MTPFDSDLATAVFILLVGFLLIAAMCDLVSYTIPDTLSIVIAGLFVIAALVLPAETSWISHLAGAAVVFVIGLAAFHFGVLGGGDAKLITAVSLWAGFPALPALLLWIALAGGVLAIVVIGLRRMLPAIAARARWMERVRRWRIL